jgi:hypothetical protein
MSEAKSAGSAFPHIAALMQASDRGDLSHQQRPASNEERKLRDEKT